MLVSFGMPLALLGLHEYLESRRWRWLVLFGVSWLVQGAANGYYLVYFHRRCRAVGGLVHGGAVDDGATWRLWRQRWLLRSFRLCRFCIATSPFSAGSACRAASERSPAIARTSRPCCARLID
jgi:hypothetical protein